MSKVFNFAEETDLFDVDTVEESTTGLTASTAADLEVAESALAPLAELCESTESIALLAAKSRQGTLADGDVLYAEGDAASSFYVVLEGRVQASRAGSPAMIFGAGDPLGLYAAAAHGRHCETAVARGELWVLDVPRAALEAAFAEDPGLSQRLAVRHRAGLLKAFLHAPLFDGLTPDARARVASCFELRTLAPAEPLVRLGEMSDMVAIPVAGALRIARASWSLSPGEFAVAACMLSGIPARFGIDGGDGCTLLVTTLRQIAAALEPDGLAAVADRLRNLGTAPCPDLWVGRR